MTDVTRGHYTGSNGRYEVVEMIYNGRPALVLYSGDHLAAQSGLALDDNPELLFDYNERFRELATGLLPERVLLIGGGGFTLPKALLAERPDLRLDIVEIDAVLHRVATEQFGFMPGAHTRVFEMGGGVFLEQSTDSYDLIILDAFVNSTIPSVFQTPATARLFAAHLRPSGVVAVNIIGSYYGSRSTALRRQVAAFRTEFSDLQLYPAGNEPSLWLPQNFILTGQQIPRDLQRFLRYRAVEVPAA